MFLGCPFFGRQGRGVLNTPHKTTRRGDLIYLWVGVFIPTGYMWGVCNTPLPYRQEIFLSCLPSIFFRNPSFSYLDTGKRMRKENQGIRDAGQFGRVPEWVVRDTGEFGHVSDPLVFSFPFFDLPSPYDSDRRYDCESRCDRATVYV